MAGTLVVTCIIALSAGAFKEPASLQELRDCHQTRLDSAAATYEKRKRVPPPAELQDAWDDLQRAETRAYLERHPDRASIDSGTTQVRRKTADAEDAGGSAKTDGDSSKSDSDTKALEKSLWEQSDGGKKGVTPEMAQAVIAHLKGQQDGQVSPEMLGLLESLAKDGPNLSDGSMAKMREAAKKAKASGMDLGVSPEIEKALLEDGSPGHN